jgi:hypothetical protein
LIQRAARKCQNSARRGLGRLGFQTTVPHSWHDYDHCWRENASLARLRPVRRTTRPLRHRLPRGPVALLQRQDLLARSLQTAALAVWRGLATAPPSAPDLAANSRVTLTVS